MEFLSTYRTAALYGNGVLAFFLSAATVLACPLCTSRNSPVGGTQDVGGKGRLTLGLTYSRAYKPTLLSESDHVDRAVVGPETYTVSMNISDLTPTIDYGINNNLGLSVSLPYIWLTGTHRLAQNEFETVKQTGFSDLIVTGRYKWVWSVFGKSLSIAALAGTTFPITDRKVDILTDHSDFTTGTVDPVIGLTGALILGENSLLRATGFTHQVWGKTANDQQVGSYYAYTLEWRRFFGDGNHSLYGRLLSEIREQYTVRGRGYRNTGGEWYYAVIGGSFTLIAGENAGLRITSELEIPVSIRVNGTQPVQGTNLRVNLTSGFVL